MRNHRAHTCATMESTRLHTRGKTNTPISNMGERQNMKTSLSQISIFLTSAAQTAASAAACACWVPSTEVERRKSKHPPPSPTSTPGQSACSTQHLHVSADLHARSSSIDTWYYIPITAPSGVPYIGYALSCCDQNLATSVQTKAYLEADNAVLYAQR